MPTLFLEWVEDDRRRPARAAPWRRLLQPRLAEKSRAILWLTLAFWLSHFLILTAGTAVAVRGHLLEITAMRALLVGFGLILCFAIHKALDRFGSGTFRRKAILAAILAPLTAELFAWVAFFGLVIVDPSRMTPTINWARAIADVSYWTWFFLAWMGLHLALSYSFDVQAERLRSAELRSHAQAAQLRALHNQVSPHFLFNSLNSLSALIGDGRTREADRMVGKLAAFFRQSLALDPFEDIGLGEEIALQRLYLDIEQLRFPDLELAIACPAELSEARIPPLILQPIVENAVKYGVAGSSPPARIRIACSASDGQLAIVVGDSGTSSTTVAGAGVGLRNVRERLAQRFGDRQSLTTSRTREGFTCTMQLPLTLPA